MPPLPASPEFVTTVTPTAGKDGKQLLEIAVSSHLAGTDLVRLYVLSPPLDKETLDHLVALLQFLASTAGWLSTVTLSQAQTVGAVLEVGVALAAKAGERAPGGGKGLASMN